MENQILFHHMIQTNYEYRIRTKVEQKFRVAQMYDSKRVRYLKFLDNMLEELRITYGLYY